MRQKILLVLLLALVGCLTPQQIHDRDLAWRKQYVADHPNMTDEYKQLILEGTFRIGMVGIDHVLAGWNKTRAMVKINSSVGSWGVHEQVVVYPNSFNSPYLYFEDNVLTSWQIPE